MLGAIAPMETTWTLWKNVFEKCCKLFTNNALKYSRDEEQNTYWSAIAFGCMHIFLENWSNRCQLLAVWKPCNFQRTVKIFSYPLLSFRSFTERSASCIAFELSRILIFFATSASVTGLKIFSRPLQIFLKRSNNKCIWMISPFYNCFQSRMVYLIMGQYFVIQGSSD